MTGKGSAPVFVNHALQSATPTVTANTISRFCDFTQQNAGASGQGDLLEQESERRLPAAVSRFAGRKPSSSPRYESAACLAAGGLGAFAVEIGAFWRHLFFWGAL